MRVSVPGRGGLAGAIRCALTRWAALARRRGGGRLAMDGNAAGRPIRPPTLGRKNRLLCGSNAGGRDAAGITPPLENAKMNGLGPEARLRHALGCIANHPANHPANHVAEPPPRAVANPPMRLDQNTPQA